jgi:hypothetical protein
LLGICSFFQPLVTSSALDPLILLSTLFSNTFPYYIYCSPSYTTVLLLYLRSIFVS